MNSEGDLFECDASGNRERIIMVLDMCEFYRENEAFFFHEKRLKNVSYVLIG